MRLMLDVFGVAIAETFLNIIFLAIRNAHASCCHFLDRDISASVISSTIPSSALRMIPSSYGNPFSFRKAS